MLYIVRVHDLRHSRRDAPACVLAPTEISQVGTFTTTPYNCTAEPASSVVASVASGAGAGKL